jgi:AcrR family transcriptional regulator
VKPAATDRTPVRRRASTVAAKRPGRSSNSLGAATRERIILVAERLFAEFGIDAMSLREVAEAAGQRNNVAIQYHFGDRDGLIRAIIAYRATATGQKRAEMLVDLLTRGREPDVRQLVAAIVLPAASQLIPDNHYLELQARLVVEHGPFHFGHTEHRGFVQLESTWNLLREAMRRRLAHLPDVLFDTRWDMAITTHILTLAGYQLAMTRGTLDAPIALLVSDLVDVLTGGLTAPVAA